MVVQLKVITPSILEYGLPTTETLGAAGYDLRASLDSPVIIQPDSIAKIPTGVAIYIEDRHIAAFIYPRSGLAAKFNLTLQNSVGVIDSDYQGELQVLLRNEGPLPYKVNPGDRIAQLVFMPVVHPMVSIVADFTSNSARGDLGFGSTGVASPSLHTDYDITVYPVHNPANAIGNDLPIVPGVEEILDIKYEPTGQELLEAEYGDE